MSLRQDALLEIRKLILTGELEPGIRTSERKLAETLHMSRPPVREALAILTQQGMIVNYPRSGMEVREVEKEEVAEIGRLLSGVEAHAVQELAKGAHSETIEKLRAIVGQLESSNYPHPFIEADVAFHSEVARLADLGSAFFAIRGLLDRVYLHNLAKTRFTDQDKGLIVKSHLGLVDRIEQRDVAAPLEAIEVHFKDV